MTPAYYIDTKSDKSFQEVLLETKNLSPLEQLKVINKEEPISFQSYLENDNYIFITYHIKSKTYCLLKNKKDGNNFYFSSIINNLDYGLWGTPMLLTDDNELFMMIYPHEIKNKLLLKDNEQKHVSIKSLKDGDNPFFVKYKLK